MKSSFLLLLVIACSARIDARQIQTSDKIFFDNDLPEDVNLNRIAEKPVRYRPFMYHQKYFPEMANDTSYTYNRNSPKAPRIWPRSFPSCGGARQSPINLLTENCLRAPAMKSLWNLKTDLQPSSVIMENNGHSIEYSFEYPGARPMLAGGPLRSMYVFEQLHFHWGTSDEEGSEHYIDSKPGELEMHVVHRNVKYENMRIAGQNPDGIVVMAILFKTDYFAADQEFLQYLGRVQQMNTSATIDGSPRGFKISDIVGSFDQPFIGYQGSLTTPPCSEAVSWLVAEEMRSISPRDIENFRSILVEKGASLAPNFRPLQDRNQRMCVIF